MLENFPGYNRLGPETKSGGVLGFIILGINLKIKVKGFQIEDVLLNAFLAIQNMSSESFVAILQEDPSTAINKIVKMGGHNP